MPHYFWLDIQFIYYLRNVFYIKNLINLKSWVTAAEFGALVVAHSFPDQGKKENVNSIITTNKPRSRMCCEYLHSPLKNTLMGGKKSRKFPFSLPAVSCKINMSPRVRSCWESVLSRAPPPPIGMDHHLCQSSHLGDELRAYSLHLYSSLFEFPFEALFLFSLSLSCYKLWFEL